MENTQPSMGPTVSEMKCGPCMPRQVEKGMVLTNQHERYEVLIDDPAVEDALEANRSAG